MPTGAQSTSSRRSVPWVSAVLLSAAAVLVLDPLRFTSPVFPDPEASAAVIDPRPVRSASLTPHYQVGVYTYLCSDCHRVLPSPEETYRSLTQHTEIELRHGINTRCFNCHHRTNRDGFVDDLGQEIPWNQPQLLCAKCHGPVYRDWQHGSHGRTNGYWDVDQGPQTRRRCIECHDPHHPPFPALVPSPGPQTLRTEPRAHGGQSPIDELSRHRASPLILEARHASADGN